jgi:large subunit ribosomal protein L30
MMPKLWQQEEALSRIVFTRHNMTKIKVKQIRSTIDRDHKQKRIIEALGLGRLNKIKEHNDTPQIRGMIFKVKHLVEVVQ